MTMTHIKSFAVSLAAGTLALPVDTLVQIPLFQGKNLVVKLPANYAYEFGDASVTIPEVPANTVNTDVDSFDMSGFVGVPYGASHVIIRNTGNAVISYVTFAAEI